MTRAYLFDIDGTLADCSHRLPHILKQPKDWDAFYAAQPDDAPFTHMVDLAVHLSSHAPLIFLTARPQRFSDATVAWLTAHKLWEGAGFRALYMRPEGDHRDDDVVKSELLDTIIAHGFRPIMAFEDRTRIVKMFRARGIPCAQVVDGDF